MNINNYVTKLGFRILEKIRCGINEKLATTDLTNDCLTHVYLPYCFVCWVTPLQSLTKQTLSTLSHYSLVQVINKPTHRCGHIIDWVIVRPDDDIHRKSTVTDSLESDHYCTKSYFNISVSKPSTIYRTVRNIANIDRPSFLLNFPLFQSFHLLKMQTSSVTFCALY